MARLPRPGADQGTWGNILNEYLSVALASDGTLKQSSVSEAKLDAGVRTKLNSTATVANGSVTTVKIADGAVTSAKLSTGIAQSKITNLATDLANKSNLNHTHTLNSLSDVNTANATNGQSLIFQSGAWVPATVTSGGGSGGVTDHGALSGLTDDDHVQYLNNARGDARYFTQAQVTTSLNAKANDSAVVHSTGNETVAGVKTFSSSPIVPTPTTGTQAATKAYVDSAVSGAGGGGGSGLTVVARTANYTAVAGNYVICNASTSGFTVTLPPAVSGATVSVKKVDGSVNAIIVQPQGGVLIDDQVTISVNMQWLSYDFLSDGVKWYRV